MTKFNNNYPCTKENIRRNLDLWNDRRHGFTYQQLSDKYRITKERCRQIYLRVERIKDHNPYYLKSLTDNLMNYCPMCGADMRGDDYGS